MNIAAIDPSLAHFGMAKLDYRPSRAKQLGEEHLFHVLELKLIDTEKDKGKAVRRNSDDLRRSREIIDALEHFTKDCEFVFAEIPSGAQNARAAFAFGIVVGILAGIRIPLIQVQPLETKKATVGTKTASKADMIEWATTRYPDAPWIKRAGKLTLANEHLADAIAIAHAGVLTDQFKQISALMKRAA